MSGIEVATVCTAAGGCAAIAATPVGLVVIGAAAAVTVAAVSFFKYMEESTKCINENNKAGRDTSECSLF